MFAVKAALRPLIRRKFRSLAVLVVSIVLVLFLNIYANAINQQRQNLDELYANIEVTAYIVDLNGNAEGLEINEKVIISPLENSGFIREGVYTQKIVGVIGPWQDEDIYEIAYDTRNTSILLGSNDVSVLPQQPEFMDGYDETLFEMEEMVCIVGEDFIADHNLSLGDELQFTARDIKRYPIQSASDFSLATVSLKIVGVYRSPVRPSLIYCPLAVASDINSGFGKPPIMNSASFILQNTKDLNRFRELLMDMNFVNQQAAPGSSSQGFSFIINDRVLKSATASVENYISFTNALYPVIYLLCAGIGFIVSYLLIRTRKPEFAIMRSLGASRAASFFTFHIEQGLLCLLGAALGLVSSTLFTGQYSLESGFGYVSFYLVGSGVAIMAMNRVNVIEILTARE